MKLLKESTLGYNDVKYLQDYVVKHLFNSYYGDKEISPELKELIVRANDAVKAASELHYKEIRKPAQDEKDRKEKERLDRSALKIDLTAEQADLVDSVLGQLSDGYWENSRAAEKYWKNIHLDGKVLVVDLDKLRNASWSATWYDEFNNIWKNPSEVKKWFARKAQTVHNADMKDEFGTLKLTPEQLDSKAKYLDRGINQTYRQIQDAINSLK